MVTMGFYLKCASIYVLFLSSLVAVTGTDILRFCGKLDVTFIVDQSESIRDDDPLDKPDHTWNLVKAFIKGLILKLNINPDWTKVALVKYSSFASVEWTLDQYSYPDQLLAAVDALQCDGGNTNTAEAFRITYNKIYRHDKRVHARNVIVILTDGLSTKDTGRIDREVTNLMSVPNTEIYAIAVGNYVDDLELKAIVGQKFGKYLIYVPDYDNLAAFEDLVAHRICGLPDPQPPGTDKCERIMDLTFIVDSSGSIAYRNFQNLKQFLVRLVSRLEVGPDLTRVAAIRFSDNATVEFHLGDYTDKAQLNEKLMGLDFENGNTNMSGAMRVAAQDVYGNVGDRPHVTDVIVMVTDGSSTLEINNTIRDARRVKQNGLQMYVIGVTDKVNVQELHQIVSKPIREHYFDSTHVVYLNSILLNLIKNLCIT